MRSQEIARRFLAFFAERGHAVVPSASLIADDPTLLLVNAGMVPFKPYFLGDAPPPWPRAASVQKVVRTPDIDIVGTTTRHNTFFQMCGNFSFGDYFKAGAIPLAWELLTSGVDAGGYGLDPARLWVTVYLDDDEGADIWTRDVGVPADRVQRLGMEDNYWDMGVPGPCGPCSEVYYDRFPERGPGGGPAVDGERYLEVWNLVFMQFERGAGEGKTFPILGPLPQQNIDTGMGLERVALLLQGVDNVYETDLLRPILDRAQGLSGARYEAGDATADVRLRVVADHTRTATMLIADGVTPGNEGRGYVVRRLLRRAVRAMRLLGATEEVMAELVTVAREVMGATYPELTRDAERIDRVAVTEEVAFRQTLDKGTARFSAYVEELRGRGEATLAGEEVFRLHDTFGFPVDLTREMAAEQGLAVDVAGFDAAMAGQRQRAQTDRRAKGIGNIDVSAFRELRAAGPTVFTGYDELATATRVRGLLRDGGPLPAAGEGEVVELVLERTPFYAESGGQDSDAGCITADGLELEVLDVQRPVRGLVVHRVRVARGEVRAGTDVLATVDADWRLGACQAHSGTHVVHAALRQVLGPSALQSGSFNRPGSLRLDFAWPQALSPETRSEVEEVANAAVRADLDVRALAMSLPAARDFGALALFGETYDETVRVVEIGGPWSRELCGGTHVAHSSQVGCIVVTGESSVGSGVRRVEALTGLEGFRALARDRSRLAALGEALKTPTAEVVERAVALAGRVRELERELAGLRGAALVAGAGALAAETRDVFGVAVVAHEAPPGTGADALRTLALDVRGRIPADRAAVVVLAAPGDGKAGIVVAVNDTGRAWGHRAGELVRVGAEQLGGAGGGKDDVAQGGGPRAGAVAEALVAVEHFVGRRATGSA